MSLVLNGNGNGNHVASQPPPLVKPTATGNKASLTTKETRVTFKTGDGLDFRGTLVRMTRQSAFFELHSPDSTPRLSEVLEPFEIVFQGRLVYAGQATVRSIVNTGVAAICETTLSETYWTDSNPVLALRQNGHLAKEFKTFLNEWQKLYKVSPEFKIIIADMHSFLAEARLWLEHAEVGIHRLPPDQQLDRQREIALELHPTLGSAVHNLFERFEDASNRVAADHVATHHAFGKRLVQPLLMGSPFVHRTFTKPLGYAGDYEMVNMMFRDPFEGASLFGKMVNLYALQLPPIVAHRNRIDYLETKLLQETLRTMTQNRDTRIFNMGCGPAQEIQRFLAKNEVSNRAHITLVDFNDETLVNTNRLLSDIKRRHARRTVIKPVKKAVHMLIKSFGRGEDYLHHSQYDFVYCAGLFDYLTDPVCQQLLEIFYAMLAPGGLLVATNVDVHPAKNQMECFLEWHLIHRNNEKMRAIAPSSAHAQDIAIKRDPAGVNVFLEVRKPTGEK